jgi:hypothetical protein
MVVGQPLHRCFGSASAYTAPNTKRFVPDGGFVGYSRSLVVNLVVVLDIYISFVGLLVILLVAFNERSFVGALHPSPFKKIRQHFILPHKFCLDR